MAEPAFTRAEKLQSALSNMESALQILDNADAPPDIGAHLDLAICRLKDAVGGFPPHAAGLSGGTI